MQAGRQRRSLRLLTHYPGEVLWEPFFHVYHWMWRRLELFIVGYRTATGPKNDVGVIDASKVSLCQFENALWHGCFTEIYDGDSTHRDKLRFFITHFSKAYIKDWKGYRNRVARSVNLSPVQLSKFTKDDGFASELKKVLPLVNYNNT